MASQQQKQKFIRFGVGFILILAITIFFRGQVLGFAGLIQKPFAAAGVSVFSQLETTVLQSNTADELSRLRNERGALLSDFSELQQLRDENTSLKKLLSFAERADQEQVSAEIISRHKTVQSNRFVINKGLSDGIKKGSPVFVENGILIGKVVNVSTHTATIASTTDDQSATAITLLNESRTIGLAEGSITGLISVRFIPQDERIAVNDLIITSGLEEFVPSGLLVGIVTAVWQDEKTPFQEAIVEPLADIRRHHIVSVLIPRE